MRSSGTRWREYLDLLKGVEDLPDLTWAPDDEQLRGEVYQQVLMNIAQGYFFYFASDPEYPDFAPFFNSALRLQPNPDDAYYMARIDGGGTYRISGERGSIHILNFTAAHDFIGTVEVPGIQEAEVDAADMVVDEQGSFELIVSGTQPEGYTGNWLFASPRTNYIMVRMRSYDWGNERDPRLAIKQLDRSLPRGRPTTAETDRQIRDLLTFAERYSRQWYAYQDGMKQRGLINRLELSRFEDLGGGSMQIYWRGLFELDPGECLVLETDVPSGVRYWNVQLNDELFNALEFLSCQSSLNGHQAQLSSDGRFRAVIAIEDPGVPNWLDCVGHRLGTIIGRWYGGSDARMPTITRMPLSALRDYLPTDTAIVSPEDRDRRLRERVRGGQMRRRW